jgi:hypothetical protein
MCLLTFIPDYVSPDLERFAVAARNNPDGFGFSILERDKFLTGHGMDFSEVANKFIDLRTKHFGPAIFHFRWATHGSETVENCHPFYLGQDPKSMMGHNGILPVKIEKGDDRSDTRVFAQDIMPAVGGITALDDDDYFKRLSAWATGSKLVFLTNNEDTKHDWYIINEKDGHWDKDMWWSNHSYEERTYSYSSFGYGSYGYGSYGGGWNMDSGRWDDDDSVHVTSHGALVPAYDEDEELYLEDLGERYEQCLANAKVFTTPIGDGIDFVECYTCAHTFYSEKNVWETHCPKCESCLYCGMLTTDKCDCWDAVYEMEMYMHTIETSENCR